MALGTLTQIKTIGRLALTIPSSATTVTDDPYLNEWENLATIARDAAVLELAAERNLLADAVTDIAITNATRTYSLATDNVLRVDRVTYGTASDERELRLVTRDEALKDVADPDETGEPVYAYLDGYSSIGIYPTSTDTSKKLYIHGPVLMATVATDTGLPAALNELIALGAAYRACEYDIFNPERQAMYPNLRARYEGVLLRVKRLLSDAFPPSPGLKTAVRRRRYVTDCRVR